MNRQERKQWYYEQTHKIINGESYKQCTKCDKWLPDTEEYFYMRNKKKPEIGLCSECKKCSSKNAQKWQIENDERYRELIKKRDENLTEKRLDNWRRHGKAQRLSGYQKEYRIKNKDKMNQYSKNRRIRNHNITDIEWDACLKYFNNSCAYCGMSQEEHKEIFNQRLHREHVIHKGTNDLSNCIPACKSCNCSKWKHSLEKWYNSKNPKFNELKLTKIYKWLNEDYKKYMQVN